MPTVPEFADALARFAQAVGVDQAVFVGSSLGAQIVAYLCSQHQELTQGAVLIGPTRDPAAPTPLRQAARLLKDLPHERPSLVLLAAISYTRAGPRRMWQLLRQALRRAVEHVLPQIDVPVLIVRGEHDPVASQAWVERMHELVPGSRLLVLPGAGHAPNYSHPRALAELIRPFIHEVSRRQGASRPSALPGGVKVGSAGDGC